MFASIKKDSKYDLFIILLKSQDIKKGDKVRSITLDGVTLTDKMTTALRVSRKDLITVEHLLSLRGVSYTWHPVNYAPSGTVW